MKFSLSTNQNVLWDDKTVAGDTLRFGWYISYSLDELDPTWRQRIEISLVRPSNHYFIIYTGVRD